jgi:hypothetical protein
MDNLMRAILMNRDEKPEGEEGKDNANNSDR